MSAATADVKVDNKAAAVDAITQASEDGVPLTLEGPNGPYLKLHVPEGYRMAGAWISKSGNADRDGVRIDIYPTDIDCTSGLTPRKDETLEAPPAGAPSTFHDRVAVRTGSKGVSYTMCSDVAGGVMIAEVNTERRGALPAELAKILASASTAAHAPGRTAPEQPAFVFEDLGRTFVVPPKAGGWRRFVFLGFTLESEWPHAANAMVTLLATDTCTYAGSHALIPSPWKADAVDEGVRSCIDANGTKFQLVVVGDTGSLSPADRERIRETVTALARTVYPATAPYIAPAVAAVAPHSTEVSSSSSSAPYTPYVPPSGRDHSPGRPLKAYLYGASLIGHMFASDGYDDNYGVSIGYQRALAARIRIALEAGYSQNSGVVIDGRLELGTHHGDTDAGIGVWGVLGVDGLGVDADEDPAAAMPPPHIAADLYYGPRVGLTMSGIDVGLSYVWRNADAVDHAWRFDAGYYLASGHYIGFRYTGYGDAGHFLALLARY